MSDLKRTKTVSLTEALMLVVGLTCCSRAARVSPPPQKGAPVFRVPEFARSNLDSVGEVMIGSLSMQDHQKLQACMSSKHLPNRLVSPTDNWARAVFSCGQETLSKLGLSKLGISYSSQARNKWFESMTGLEISCLRKKGFSIREVVEQDGSAGWTPKNSAPAPDEMVVRACADSALVELGPIPSLQQTG